MVEAIEVRAHGGPEVLTRVDVDVPPPGPGEVRVRHAAQAHRDLEGRRTTGSTVLVP